MSANKKPINFTFRKDKTHTGLARVCQVKGSDIFIKRKRIGRIGPVNPHSYHDYQVSVTVPKEPTREEPSNFKHVRFKRRFDSDEEARVWVKEKLLMALNQNNITALYCTGEGETITL